jgi:hypothetical protein
MIKQSTLAAIAALAVLASTPAFAQSLDEQYAFYLGGKCQQMGFLKDSEGIVQPGQAAPILAAFCSGPGAVGGSGGANSLGGNAGAAGAAGGTEDTLRRRRERAHDNADTPEVGTTAANIGNLGLFLSIDAQREKQDATRFESGRDADLSSLLFGVDYRFGARGVLGLALRAGDTSGEFANDVGDFSSSNVGGVAYGSWFAENGFFMDFAASYGKTSTETTRLVGILVTVIASPMSPPTFRPEPDFAPVASDSIASEKSFEFRTGIDFQFGALALGPRAAFTHRRVSTDAFTERGFTPMRLTFQQQDEVSAQSAIGLQMSFAKNTEKLVLVTQFNADWLHEFDDDQRHMAARFADDLRDDPTIVLFENEAPDRDNYAARLSVVAVGQNGFNVFLSASALIGHTYLDRHGVSLGFRKEL